MKKSDAEKYQDLVDETTKQILLLHGGMDNVNDESIIQFKELVAEVCMVYTKLLFSNKFVGVKQQ